MARKFFYVCAGLFLLAASYHLGARSAGAQGGTQVTGIAYHPGTGMLVVMTPNGDLFSHAVDPWTAGSLNALGPATYLGNIWSGATPSTQSSWGALKVKAR